MKVEFKWPEGGQNYLPYDIVMDGLTRMFNEKMPDAKFSRQGRNFIESESPKISIAIYAGIGKGTFEAFPHSEWGKSFLIHNIEKFESCLF